MSHPTWVRGLKHVLFVVGLSLLKSHPTWVRGLKHVLFVVGLSLLKSHPTWVRGLKLYNSDTCKSNQNVAPYVGAWIETPPTAWGGFHLIVAPYVGAWIETCMDCSQHGSCKSHPTWVRGLKHDKGEFIKLAKDVAPYVGAWIETSPLQLCW